MAGGFMAIVAVGVMMVCCGMAIVARGVAMVAWRGIFSTDNSAMSGVCVIFLLAHWTLFGFPLALPDPFPTLLTPTQNGHKF